MGYDDQIFRVKSGREPIKAHRTPCNENELEIHDFCIVNKPEYRIYKFMADFGLDTRWDVNAKGQYINRNDVPFEEDLQSEDSQQAAEFIGKAWLSENELQDFVLIQTPSGLAEYMFPNLAYVNAYVEGQNFGGPEEGGWWYKSGEPLASVPVKNEADVKTVISVLKRSLKDVEQAGEYHHPMDGKDDYDQDYGGDDTGISFSGKNLKIFVQAYKAESYPKHTPRYE